MLQVIAQVPPPSTPLTAIAFGCFLAGVGVLVSVAVHWNQEDGRYDKNTSFWFADEDWHAVRRVQLPLGLSLLCMGGGILVAKYWPQAPSGIILLLFLAFVGLFGVSLFIHVWNRPKFLVRPALRDKPGTWEEGRMLKQERKRQRAMAQQQRKL